MLKIGDDQLAYARQKSPALYRAAMAQCVLGSLRVHLCAPRSGAFEAAIEKAGKNLKIMAPAVLQDSQISRKLRRLLEEYLNTTIKHDNIESDSL